MAISSKTTLLWNHRGESSGFCLQLSEELLSFYYWLTNLPNLPIIPSK